MSMPKYSAYSSTSLTAHLKSYCDQTSSCAGVGSPPPPFQPMSETTATFIISALSVPPPSATSCWYLCSFSASSSWMDRAAACAASRAASSSSFFFLSSSRFFFAERRSNDIWRARWKRFWRSVSSASSFFRFCSSSFSRSLRSSSSFLSRSSSAFRFASSSAFRLRSISSRFALSRFLARKTRTIICIAMALEAMNSIRRCSSRSRTPTPRKTLVLPMRYSASGT
mmetsp:Transcript_26651/g.80779  ORF Transcript_26651/g.80779 Transcript_26651/m.80779 type:complete len:226 (+) Transcript_26651:2287-2964(+)